MRHIGSLRGARNAYRRPSLVVSKPDLAALAVLWRHARLTDAHLSSSIWVYDFVRTGEARARKAAEKAAKAKGGRARDAA